MAYKIDQSNDSIQDFFNILDYLAYTLFSPSAAGHFSDEIEACYGRLTEYPLIYPVCQDKRLAAKGFRLAPVMRYIAFYTVDEERQIVRIHRILHGSMDYTRQGMKTTLY